MVLTHRVLRGGRLAVLVGGLIGGVTGTADAQVAQSGVAPARRGEAGTDLPLSYPRSARFTTDEGTWLSLDVSPDGRTIAFDLAGDLYTLPITGGEATRITSGPGFDAQPRFSPDGRRILFQSDRTGAENLYTVRPDGQDLQALTVGDGQAYLSPTWTPDGRSVVVSSSAYPAGLYGLGLYVFPAAEPAVPAAAGTGTKLPLRHGEYLGAAFGPDTHLVYYSPKYESEGHGNPAEFAWKLQRYNLETKTQEDVALAVGGAFRPLLSPDGQWLVYATRHDTGTSLRLRNLATQQERWLLHGVERDAQEASYTRDLMPSSAFTPDSRAIITTRQGKFWRVEVPSGKVTPIPFTAMIDVALGPRVHFEYPLDDSVLTVRGIRDPQLAPDNRRVVFTALSRLYVMDLPRGRPRRLTTADVGEGPGEYHPVWSPDGRWIAYVTWDGREGAVYRVRADGRGRPERLTRQPGFYRRVAYTPSGSRLLVWRAAQPMWFGGQASQTATALVWLPATGGEATVILAGGGAREVALPYFVRGDSTRIYLGAESIRWDGTDRQRHLQGDVTLSPDGTRVVRGSGDAELWLAMVPATPGALATSAHAQEHAPSEPSDRPSGDSTSAGAGEAPSPPAPLAERPVSGVESMAEFPAWSLDGTKVVWAGGRSLFLYDVVRAEAAIADSVQRTAAGGGPPAGPAYVPERIAVTLTRPKDRPRGVVALRNARLITMRGDAVLERGDLVVTNNRITAVGPAGTVRVPAGARVFDLAGTTVMPGLVDIHAHPSTFGDVHHQPWKYAAQLAYGVTTLRDPSSGNGTDVLTYSDLVEAGAILGPRSFFTGSAIGGPPPEFQTLDGARRFLRRYAEIYQSQTIKGYALGERRRRQHFLIAARELGLTPTLEGGRDFKRNITEAIDGYSGQEHAYPLVPLYRDMVEIIARSGITYTPTLLVAYGGPMSENYMYAKYQHMHDDPKLRRFVPHSYLDRRFLRRGQWFADKQFVHEQVAAQAAKIIRAGGRVGLGGHGQLPGLGEHWELWLLQSGGMTPLEALRCATLFGAEAIGHGKDLGSLEVGKLADLLVLDQNPLEDIHHTTAIRYVMKNGRLYEGDTLHEIWPRQRPMSPGWWTE